MEPVSPLVTIRRSLATLAVVLLILIAGVALLYATRAQVPPTTAVSSSTPTATATATASASTTPVGSTSAPILAFIRCGTLAPNSITSGQGAGPNVFELRSPTGISVASFGWPGSGQPPLGTYLCVRLTPGAPTAGFVAVVAPGEPGYVASAWASTCGTVSEFVAAAGATNGSFVLNSPSRAPLKVTIPPTTSGQLSGYICASIYGTGAPSATFAGLWAPNTAGFIAEGTLPASKASQMPDGFVLPQSCLYIAPPIVGADQREWSVECGATANRDARGTLAPALTQQGWTSCGAATATASWAKGTTRLSVVESSGSPGDYPRIVQPVRPAASSSCP